MSSSTLQDYVRERGGGRNIPRYEVAFWKLRRGSHTDVKVRFWKTRSRDIREEEE